MQLTAFPQQQDRQQSQQQHRGSWFPSPQPRGSASSSRPSAAASSSAACGLLVMASAYCPPRPRSGRLQVCVGWAVSLLSVVVQYLRGCVGLQQTLGCVKQCFERSWPRLMPAPPLPHVTSSPVLHAAVCTCNPPSPKTHRPVPTGAKAGGAGAAAAVGTATRMTAALARSGPLETAVGPAASAGEVSVGAVATAGEGAAGTTAGSRLGTMLSTKQCSIACGCGSCCVQPASCAACISWCSLTLLQTWAPSQQAAHTWSMWPWRAEGVTRGLHDALLKLYTSTHLELLLGL